MPEGVKEILLYTWWPQLLNISEIFRGQITVLVTQLRCFPKRKGREGERREGGREGGRNLKRPMEGLKRKDVQ